jgi:hypothetical protein
VEGHDDAVTHLNPVGLWTNGLDNADAAMTDNDGIVRRGRSLYTNRGNHQLAASSTNLVIWSSGYLVIDFAIEQSNNQITDQITR